MSSKPQTVMIKKKKPKAKAEPKKVMIKKKKPVLGPRNLKKGFGIKRMPKKKVSTFTFNEIVGDNDETFLYPAEENVMDSLGYSNWSWLDGITDSMYRFYTNNSYRRDELSEKKQDRLGRIEEKINDGVRPSLIKQFRKEFKKWKEFRKDERMTEQQAIKSFETYYF